MKMKKIHKNNGMRGEQNSSERKSDNRQVRSSVFKFAALQLLAVLAAPATAQQDLGEINNGTNPTLLTTQFALQYQYNEINSD